MCFTLRHSDVIGSAVAAKIATAPIETFKFFRKDGKILRSPHRDYEWEIGEIVREDNLQRFKKGYDREIHAGLHSLKSMKDAIHYKDNHNWTGDLTGSIVVKCTIPAGSIYWENDSQYVSEQLMINDGRALQSNGNPYPRRVRKTATKIAKTLPKKRLPKKKK